jgi:hypothetical protein
MKGTLMAVVDAAVGVGSHDGGAVGDTSAATPRSMPPRLEDEMGCLFAMFAGLLPAGLGSVLGSADGTMARYFRRG